MREYWAPRGNHVGPLGQSRGPPWEITWAPTRLKRMVITYTTAVMIGMDVLKRKPLY